MKHKHYNEIIAFAEGKTIEIYNRNSYKWAVTTQPTWNTDFRYRVKPEPEYVPFTFDDAEHLIGKAVRFKGGEIMRVIGSLNVFELNLCRYASPISYEKLLELYTFLDGTPCGKLKTDSDE